jgi:hypothetical protein
VKGKSSYNLPKIVSARRKSTNLIISKMSYGNSSDSSNSETLKSIKTLKVTPNYNLKEHLMNKIILPYLIESAHDACINMN